MELSNYGLPRTVKERMILEYLSGLKTARMLSDESGMSLIAIQRMLKRHKDKFLVTFENKPIIPPLMKEKSQPVVSNTLEHEILELRSQLQEAQLKLEGYEIMGDLLAEQYGIDLLKKSVAKQSPDLKNDTQE